MLWPVWNPNNAVSLLGIGVSDGSAPKARAPGGSGYIRSNERCFLLVSFGKLSLAGSVYVRCIVTALPARADGFKRHVGERLTVGEPAFLLSVNHCF